MAPFFAACDVPGPPAANSRGADVVGDFQMSLTTEPNPATAGPVTIVVDVRDAQGRPVEGATVTILSRMEGMGHGGMDGQFADKSGGRYERAGGFSMPGPWLLTIEASKEASMLSRKTFEVMVR